MNRPLLVPHSLGCLRSEYSGCQMTISQVLDVVQQPRVLRLGDRLHAVTFDLLKLVAARHMLRVACAQGQVRSGTRILESTSGTMGLALALACREIELPLLVVGDNGSFDHALRARLHALGAETEIVTGPFGDGGPQAARIARLQERMAANRDSFWTRQYENPEAREAYRLLVPRLAASLPRVDVLVAPVGTGASACGLIAGLRAADPSVRLVAVDTHGSVLFGQRDAPRHLRGLGNSIVPKNLLHELIDEVHWVAADEGALATRKLFHDYGIDAGPSSGAAFLVASWIARTEPAATVAFSCADTGERYRSTLLDEVWLREREIYSTELPLEPGLVNHPRRCPAHWCRMAWRRQRLADLPPPSDEVKEIPR